MQRNNVKLYFVMTLLLIISSLTYQPAAAQEAPSLFDVFPLRGGLGEEIIMLLTGDGFDNLRELNGVFLYEQEVNVREYAFISNQFIEVRLVIPQQIPIGETEITFIFDDFPMDARFIITESGEQEFSPTINQIIPREGLVETEVMLQIEGSRLFELGDLGGVIIGGLEIPILEVNFSSDRLMVIWIFLPPEAPIGESEITLYFENLRYQDFFLVQRPEDEQPGPSVIYGISPNEGFPDSDVDLLLDGDNLFGLGELVGLTVADMDVPINYFGVESNQLAAVGLYLPPELPSGETGITFYFENYTFEDAFFVVREELRSDEQNQPELWYIDPQEGEIDTDIELYLEGQHLFNLSPLLSVTVSEFEIEVWDYEIESDESMVISAYLPEGTPLGDQSITVSFENANLSEYFYVSEPSGFDLPPEILILIGVVVVVGGVVVVRMLRKPEPTLEEKPGEPITKLKFNVEIDLGTQHIEISDPDQTMEFKVNFKVDKDQGEQSIESEDNPLIDDD